MGEIRVIVRSGLGLWLALGLRLHGTEVAVVTLYRLHSWQTVVYVVYTTDVPLINILYDMMGGYRIL